MGAWRCLAADEPTDGEIAIVDGRIAQIGRGLERAGATIIDARGLLVLPGCDRSARALL
jgi:dihydroorotase-like cyclic amidohydrolase